jgi:hypothetical protein
VARSGFGNSQWNVVERIIMAMAPNADSQKDVKMNTLTIELPVEGLPSPAELPNNFPEEARYLLALNLFEQGVFRPARQGGWPAWGASSFCWPRVATACPWWT